MAAVLCPDCTKKIVIGPKPKIGQFVSCPHCEAYLEIVSTSPLELDWPIDGDIEFSDWDDDDDIDEDDDWDYIEEDDEDDALDLEEEEDF